MYSLENLHNIEVLVFSNYAFSLEVLMASHEVPSHFIKISLTTHEVIMAIAVWEKCFGFMIRPQNPETHVSFKKLAPGSWRVALQGGRQNILKLLLATGFEVIRFQVSDMSAQTQVQEEAFFGYSIRVPLSRVACKMDVFLREMDSIRSSSHQEEVRSTFSESLPSVNLSLKDQSGSDQMAAPEEVAATIENHEIQRQSVYTRQSIYNNSGQTHIFQDRSESSQSSNNTSENPSPCGRSPLGVMHAQPNANENAHAYTHDSPTVITETIRLSKNEVSAIIGPQGNRIAMIHNATNCRISVLPVTLETMNSRFRTSDLPQTISLKGKPQQVAQAKIMLRRALLELRSK